MYESTLSTDNKLIMEIKLIETWHLPRLPCCHGNRLTSAPSPMRIWTPQTISFDVSKSHSLLSFSISLLHIAHTFKDGKVEALVWSSLERNQECPRFCFITVLAFICMPQIKQRWVKVSRSWGKDLNDAISSNPQYPQALLAVHWCCEVPQRHVRRRP